LLVRTAPDVVLSAPPCRKNVAPRSDGDFDGP